MKSIFIALMLCASFISCTENKRARQFGGSETITLPQGQKLVMITWKESNMWYLTKPMSKVDSAETYTFQEKSSWGVWQGTITVHEVK